MAECQAPYVYDATSVKELKGLLSPRRYNTYLVKAGHKEELAFQLYLYNARLAKAFLFPLHMVEIVLRNAVDDVLTSQFGPGWPTNPKFVQILTAESAAALQKSVAWVANGKKQHKDDVVAHLTFDFWSNLFRSEYDRSIWQTNMARLLPEAPKKSRAELQPLVASINRLRNRIAHHEPVFAENATQRYREIMDVIGFRSAIAAAWVKSHSTVHQAIRSKPSASGVSGPTVGERCDAKFVCLHTETTLSECKVELVSAEFIICMRSQTSWDAVLDRADLGRYVAAQVDESGLIDFGEHTLGDVVELAGATKAFSVIDAQSPLSMLPDRLKDPRRFVLVTENSGKTLKGVIAQAHRRY